MSLEGGAEEEKKKEPEEETGPRAEMVAEALDWALNLVTQCPKFEHGCTDVLNLICANEDAARTRVAQQLCTRVKERAGTKSPELKALFAPIPVPGGGGM